MKKRLILSSFLVLTFGLMISIVSANSGFGSGFIYDEVTIKFVDSLTLDPIIDSEIKVYPEGGYENPKFYTTDSHGEIIIPVEADSYTLRSDKGDNINYVKSSGSILFSTMEEPEYTIYLNPIFDIQVELKTDFNFLFSFFRMFRYGSYVEAPASELNLDSVIEPNCFMRTLQKGETIKKYSKTIDLKAYFSRDLNSPTKEPYNCSIYAWESIRNVGGIKQIDFSSMKIGQTNSFELPLDMEYDELIDQYPRIKSSG